MEMAQNMKAQDICLCVHMHVDSSWLSMRCLWEQRGITPSKLFSKILATKSPSLQMLWEQTASSSICCTLNQQQSVSYTTPVCNGSQTGWSGRAVATLWCSHQGPQAQHVSWMPREGGGMRFTQCWTLQLPVPGSPVTWTFKSRQSSALNCKP